MCIKQEKKYLVKVGSHSDLKFLMESDSVEEVKLAVSNYIKEKIENSYYHRIIFDEPHIWIDYGSWTDFVYIYFCDLEAKITYIGEETWKKMMNA